MKSVIKLLVVVLVAVSIAFTYYKTVVQKTFFVSNLEESTQE
jgi:uncharacterized protein YxeA